MVWHPRGCDTWKSYPPVSHFPMWDRWWRGGGYGFQASGFEYICWPQTLTLGNRSPSPLPCLTPPGVRQTREEVRFQVSNHPNQTKWGGGGWYLEIVHLLIRLTHFQVPGFGYTWWHRIQISKNRTPHHQVWENAIFRCQDLNIRVDIKFWHLETAPLNSQRVKFRQQEVKWEARTPFLITVFC